MNSAKSVIAIVDDELSICKALERLLRSAGLTAKTFIGGEEFLRYLQTDKPACAVIDLFMPGTDGFALLEYLAHDDCKLPVIIITGNDDEEAYARAMEADIVAYLRKPVDGQVLLDVIAPAIAGTENSSSLSYNLIPYVG